MMPKESQCINGWLHAFNIVEGNEHGVNEACSRCGKNVFFKVMEGRADNQEYLKYHTRQALTPEHPSFYREYFYSREVLSSFNYEY